MPALKVNQFKINQAAKFLGVSSKTLRRWEDRSVLIPIRTPGNQRVYELTSLVEFRRHLKSIRSQARKAPVYESDQIKNKILHIERHPQKLIKEFEILPVQKVILTSFAIGLIAVGSLVILNKKGLFKVSELEKNQTALSEVLIKTREKIGPSIVAATLPSFRFPRKVDQNISYTNFKDSAVLAAVDIQDSIFGIGIPAKFAKDVEVIGNLTAPNITYSVTAGDGITVTGGQNPVVSLADDTLNTFDTITVGTTDLVAEGNDILTFAAGSNVSISVDEALKKLTISSTDTDTNTSGWTDTGTTVRLTTLTDTVTINGIANIGDGADAVVISGSTVSLTSADDIVFDDSQLTSPINLSTSATGFTSGDTAIVDAINTAYAAATGGSGGVWSLTAGVIHPTTVTNDVAVGGSTLAASIFSIDESAGTFLFGGDQSANPTLTFEATDSDTGDFGFNTNDAFYFTGANVGIGTSTPSRSLNIGGSTALSSLVLIDGTLTGSGASALFSNPSVSPSSASTDYYFGLSFIPVSNSTNLTNGGLGGIYGGSYFYGSGTLNEAFGAYLDNQVVDTATVNTGYSLYIKNPTKDAGATLTTNYGILLGDQTGGTTDYGIAIEGADTQALWISSGANNTDSANGIAFGASRDTNLYRSAADVLRTDDNFIANRDITINGGDLISGTSSFNLINTVATTLNIGGASTTLNIGPTGASGSIVMSGGSADTGCTLDGTTGNFTCSGNITGSSSGTSGFWTRTSTTLSPATANDVVSISSNDTTNPVLALTSSGASANAFSLTANSTTTGNAQSITAGNLTTGHALSVTATNKNSASLSSDLMLFSLTNAQSTLANPNFNALAVNFVNDPTVAGNTENVLRIQNQVTANTTDNAVASLLLLDNADTSGTGSTVVTDALRITNSGAIAAGITNGITFGSTTIDTGLNFSSTPTTNYISGTNFSVTAAGLGTFASNVAANGGSLTTSSTTGNLFNATATTVNIAGAGTTINFGPTGASGNIVMSGGSADTGCTLDGTTGNFTCSGAVTGSNGAFASTLQNAYDNDTNGSDTIITLTTSDDSLIFRNPATSGSDSAFTVEIENLETGNADSAFKNFYTTSSGSFTTAGGNITNYGSYFSNISTESAGSNTLTNVGLYATASGADANYAAIFEAGNVGIGTTAPTTKLTVLDSTNPALLTLASSITASWSQIAGDGTGWTHESIYSLTIWDGKLIAGTGQDNGDAEVYEYNGTSWTKIGGDTVNSSWNSTDYNRVHSLASYNGKLYAGLGENAGEGEIWEYNGTAWSQIGGDSVNSSWSTSERVQTIVGFNGILYVGTGTTSTAGAGDVWSYNIGTSTWTQVGGDGLNSSWAASTYERVHHLIVHKGKLYAGLGESTGDGEVWEYNGSTWTQIGGDGVNSSWSTALRAQNLVSFNGKLYAGLSSGVAGDADVWEYNGSTWTQIGGDGVNSSWNTNYEFVAWLTDYNGSLYVSLGQTTGDDEVWKYNGSTWTQIGGDGLNSGWNGEYDRVQVMQVYNSKLYAGMSFSTGDADIWVYDASAATTLARNDTGISIGNYLFLGEKGYVGVGETSPESTLDVQGSFRVSDSLLLAQDGIVSTLGNLGVGTTAPDAALEINHATGDNLRLTYNDANGSATAYTDFSLASDGDLTIESAGNNVTLGASDLFTIPGVEGSNALTITAGDALLSDGSLSITDDDNTSTTGVINLNVDSITTNNVGLNIDYTSQSGVTGAADLFAGKINLVQNDTDGDLFGLWIDNNATATTIAGTNLVDCLLCLNNSENQAAAVLNAIYIASSGATAGSITNGINIATTDVTTDIILQNAETIDNNVDGTIDISAEVLINLDGGAVTTEALCGNQADGDAADTNDIRISDCSDTPTADYMEMYSVEAGVEYGDIVAPSNTYVTSINGERMTKLTKSTQSYQKSAIGIASDKDAAGDFNSIGYNIKDEDNPWPVALSGRLAVKVTQSSEPISIGDFVATSDEPGKAMKATRAGIVIGKALEAWDPGTGQSKVLVFVHNAWEDPNNQLAFDENGNLIVNNPEGEASSYGSQILSLEDRVTALEDATPSGELNATDSAGLLDTVNLLTTRIDFLQSQIELLQNATPSGEIAQIATSSGSFTDLLVLGNTVLSDTVVNGNVTIGNITIDSINSSIDALGVLKIQESNIGDIQFQGDKIEMTTAGDLVIKEGVIAGNDTFRGNVSFAAGETSVVVNKTGVWTTPPATIQATPSFRTTAWITDITIDGFTVNVSSAPTTTKDIFWTAIW